MLWQICKALCSVEQAQPLGPLQQHLHGRRLPVYPPAGRALPHRFQPVADRLKRDVGIRALDSSDDGGKAVVGFTAPGAVKDRVGQKAVADLGIHGA